MRVLIVRHNEATGNLEKNVDDSEDDAPSNYRTLRLHWLGRGVDRLRHADPQPGASEADGGSRDPEMPEVRAWAGRVSPAMERDFAQSFQQESPADFPRGADGVVRYPHLALSGGGANGAFGAGFLNGWSTTRQSSGLQDRHWRVDRRADGAVRVPRAAVRRRAARVLHDDERRATSSPSDRSDRS